MDTETELIHRYRTTPLSSFHLLQYNKIKQVFKKEYFSTVIVYFYSAVHNSSRNKHTKSNVYRYWQIKCSFYLIMILACQCDLLVNC